MREDLDDAFVPGSLLYMGTGDLREQIHQIRNALQVAGVTVDLLRRSRVTDAEMAILLERLDRQLVRIDSEVGRLASGTEPQAGALGRGESEAVELTPVAPLAAPVMSGVRLVRV